MLLRIFLYFCILITVENICSGIWRMFISKEFTPDQKKQGVCWSYVYMWPIYLVFPILFELLLGTYSHLFWVWIILIDYTIGVVLITLIESLFGFIYEKTYPKYCPWGKYTAEQRGIVFLGGYSRWDISLIFGVFAIAFHGLVILLKG
jgi:hypothetical protein